MRTHDLMSLRQGAAHETAELLQCRIRDPVVCVEAVPPARHEALLEQQSQMLARVGLGRLGQGAQVLDGALPFEEGLEERQAGPVAERPEAPREQVQRRAPSIRAASNSSALRTSRTNGPDACSRSACSSRGAIVGASSSPRLCRRIAAMLAGGGAVPERRATSAAPRNCRAPCPFTTSPPGSGTTSPDGSANHDAARGSSVPQC